MEAVSVLEDVRAFQTRRGNLRYLAGDADGRQYTTFREAIGERAKPLKGRRVRIAYHEEQRGDYTNVYLDTLGPIEEPAEAGDTNASRRRGAPQSRWLSGSWASRTRRSRRRSSIGS